jgi:Protein of unknown function (DUF2510)
MTNASGPSTPAGWHPDPAGSDQLRWWDGVAWTAHLAPRPVPTPNPAPAWEPAQDHYASQAQDFSDFGGYQRFPTNTAPAYRMTMEDASPFKWNTVWIWIIVLMPVVGVLILSSLIEACLVDLAATPSDALLWVFAFVGFFLGGWVLYIVLAYQDRRVLRIWGYPSPPSPWWILLTPVYVILRTVNVRRESGHGIAPLIVYFVAGFVAVVLFLVLSAIGVATDQSTQGEFQRSLFEQEAVKGLDSHGGNYTFVCPPDFSLAVGSEFTCTATDESDSISHSIAIEIVAGANGEPTPKLLSVTPPITN